MTARLQHIRKPLPRRGGNSFYRDRRDLSALAATFCGAEVTAYDVTTRDATTKKAQHFYRTHADTWQLCPACKSAAGVS